MRAMPMPLAVVLGLVLLGLNLTACASAGYGERPAYSGYEGGGAPAGEAGGYDRGGGSAAPSDADGILTTESAAEERGVFDFIDDALAGPAKAESPPPPSGPPPPAPAPAAPKAGAPVPPSTGDKPPVEASAAKRLVIYKGSLVVLVPVVEAAIEKLSARAAELSGYVENQSGNSSANNGTVTLRVPAEKFYALVNELGSYGQVTQKNVSASDVTKTVFDIELRMETAEKSRQRLLDLLKSATKMEEILQIENEVRRLTTEIEAMKGELRFLKDQVAFSTLAVTFYSNAPPPIAGPTRTRSRFEWINQVGIEQVLYNF